MARMCRGCATGDHADCLRWLMRDNPCQCVCDDAPRQLHLPLGIIEPPPAPGTKRVEAGGQESRDEVPW